MLPAFVLPLGTGFPSSVAGLYFQRFLAIAQAAVSTRGLPLVIKIEHEVTDPKSLTT